MRLTELNLQQPEPQKLARALATVLVNLSKDNFKIFELSGTTDSSIDTSKQFRHAIGHQPGFILFQEGRVYVPLNGISENNIDIRSAFASESFKLLLVA